MGNSAGVIGLYFAAFESLLFSQIDGAVADEAVTVAAGERRRRASAGASKQQQARSSKQAENAAAAQGRQGAV
jgi:hypothetical protein